MVHPHYQQRGGCLHEGAAYNKRPVATRIKDNARSGRCTSVTRGLTTSSPTPSSSGLGEEGIANDTRARWDDGSKRSHTATTSVRCLRQGTIGENVDESVSASVG